MISVYFSQYTFSINMFFYNTITFSDVGTSGYGKQSSLIFNIGQIACFEQYITFCDS